MTDLARTARWRTFWTALDFALIGLALGSLLLGWCMWAGA